MPEYHGSCHCGAVEILLTKPKPIDRLLECNCTICRKKGIVHTPAEDAELTIIKGADALEMYRFNTGAAEHPFCRHCGIHVFGRPRNNPGRHTVNARCLDDYEALRAAITPAQFDGQNHPKDRG